MNIAVIPAKKNSLRIKNKNFKIFYKKPMIYWTIKKIKKTKLFDDIVILSDHKSISKYAKKYKTNFFLRPKELSKEKYGIQDVVNNYLKKIKIVKKKINICCVFPCSPLMMSGDLQKGSKLLSKYKSKFIFAASDFSHPIEKSFKIKKEIRFNFKKNNQKISSKFLEKNYHDTGYFYWGTKESWMKKEINYEKNCKVIKIPNWRAQDIDTINDWVKAELIFKSINKKI